MSKFEKIVQYIDTHYCDPNVNVNYILHKFTICYSDLYEKFYFKLGMPPHKYLESKRLEHGVELILKNCW